jgi:hypothetical protein
MQETEIINNKTTILPHQKAIFGRLCAVARGCLLTNRAAIGFKLRANFILLGPSGSGKTFLARALADEMQVPFLSISTSDWILLGSSNRGSTSTWPGIFNFIERSMNAQGVIIFVDELDKCNHDSNWNTFLRSEVFSLCDSRIPLNLNDMDEGVVSDSRVAKVQAFLENKTMIVAGAAFQDIWERKSSPSMGFISEDNSGSLPDPEDLVKTLPRELINRFSSELFILPELTKTDYKRMVETMADQVPEVWRARFLELGYSRIAEAVRHRKGARYMEEILLSAIVEERGSLANFVPSPVSTERTVDGPEPLDLQIF